MNSFNNRLKTSKIIAKESKPTKEKYLYPLNNYVANSTKLNDYTGNNNKNKLEDKKRNCIDNSNPLKSSYNPPNSYFSNYHKSNNLINFNNHSLFDSNKQKLINPNSDCKFVQFASKGKNNIMNNNCNKICLCSSRNFQLSNKNIKYIDEYHKRQKNDLDKYDKKGNNIKNNKFNTRNNSFYKNYTEVSNHTILYRNYNSKTINLNKSNNNTIYLKNSSNYHRDKYYNTTDNSKNKSNNKIYRGRNVNNINDDKYSTEKNSQEKIKKKPLNNKSNNLNNKQNKESHSPSFIKTKNQNSPDNYSNYNYKKRNRTSLLEKNNKTNNNILINLKLDKLDEIMPIKLNIKCANKEKLSRLKRIIEKSSANHNFYKIEFPKLPKDIIQIYNNNNKINKSADNKNEEEKNNENNVNNKKLIFKKKKIESINTNIISSKNEDKKHENNILITSPKNKLKSKNSTDIIINQRNYNLIKDNNKIQSLVASYNLCINRNNENKLSSKETEQTSYKKKKKKIEDIIYNNEDTISLSYSKEKNLSISSKEIKNDDISISLPLLMEHFNIQYDIYTKKLIKTDKNKNLDNNIKKNIIFENVDSEDDDYQLTKEIILLKKGLSKKEELNDDLIKKINASIKPERNFNVTVLGNKKIYRKKITSYMNHNFVK